MTDKNLKYTPPNSPLNINNSNNSNNSNNKDIQKTMVPEPSENNSNSNSNSPVKNMINQKKRSFDNDDLTNEDNTNKKAKESNEDDSRSRYNLNMLLKASQSPNQSPVPSPRGSPKSSNILKILVSKDQEYEIPTHFVTQNQQQTLSNINLKSLSSPGSSSSTPPTLSNSNQNIPTLLIPSNSSSSSSTSTTPNTNDVKKYEELKMEKSLMEKDYQNQIDQLKNQLKQQQQQQVQILLQLQQQQQHQQLQLQHHQHQQQRKSQSGSSSPKATVDPVEFLLHELKEIKSQQLEMKNAIAMETMQHLSLKMEEFKKAFIEYQTFFENRLNTTDERMHSYCLKVAELDKIIYHYFYPTSGKIPSSPSVSSHNQSSKENSPRDHSPHLYSSHSPRFQHPSAPTTPTSKSQPITSSPLPEKPTDYTKKPNPILQQKLQQRIHLQEQQQAAQQQQIGATQQQNQQQSTSNPQTPQPLSPTHFSTSSPQNKGLHPSYPPAYSIDMYHDSRYYPYPSHPYPPVSYYH
ncbi:hypothetical protein CYY_008514 [Polysphondylium violaceum]|uniref:Uncharacterized protein n=1 Tax=Polysphondylium violaceum TaxID=133409 RepID=A0A8J4V169_9MYCE|nr:hypothetical protein CYY_008514 [Polysphondylium violaceum]